ncbi:hypothetical protein CUMW_270340, partial [Citrus unshiu]
QESKTMKMKSLAKGLLNVLVVDFEYFMVKMKSLAKGLLKCSADELIPEDEYLMIVKAYFHKVPFLTNVSMLVVVTFSYLASLGCIMFAEYLFWLICLIRRNSFPSVSIGFSTNRNRALGKVLLLVVLCLCFFIHHIFRIHALIQRVKPFPGCFVAKL